MTSDALLLATIALPFLGSVAAAFLPTNARNAEAWLAGAIALVDVGLVSLLFASVRDGGIVRGAIEWVPGANLDFIVRLDGFA